MDNALLIIVLAVACISVGIVRIGSWVIAQHEQEQTRVLLQQVYAACAIAQARAELDATGWTEGDESAYQRNPSAYDRELPGMLEASDFMGGRDYDLDPVTRSEALYQAEITATKRGDLLGAARLAEQQESLCGR